MFSLRFHPRPSRPHPHPNVFSHRPVRITFLQGFVDNFLELCEDPYGSFIARDLLEILCGRGSLDPSKKKKDKKKKNSILDLSVTAASVRFVSDKFSTSSKILLVACSSDTMRCHLGSLSILFGALVPLVERPDLP